MHTYRNEIANSLSKVLATAIIQLPSSNKLTNIIQKSAKKLAKKLIKLQGKVRQPIPIIIEKIIANTNHKAVTQKVVIAKVK